MRLKSKLPARPVPIPGESPGGVLMRAVEHNGFPNLQSLIWARWKISWGDRWASASYVDPKRYREIIKALGIKDASNGSPAFSRAGPTSESARYLDGMVIPEHLFREDGRYYCPECLSERPYWRRVWTLRTFSVCPTHHKLLLKDCPACGAQLHPWRGKLAECDCGADLSAVESVPADPAALQWWLDCHHAGSHDPRIVDAAILALNELDSLGDQPQEEHRRLEAVYEWFEKEKVAEYVSTLVDERSGAIHPRIQLLPLLRSEHQELRNLARAILQGWVQRTPEKIPDAEGALHTRDAELALGVSGFQFKKFKQLGLVGPPSHGSTRGLIDRRAVNGILYAMQTSSAVSVETEGRRRTSSLAAMVKDVLSGKRTTAGYDVAHGLGTLRVVSTQSVEAKDAECDEWWDVKQIAEKLGTYPDAVRFLVKNGWIASRDRDLQNRKRLTARRQTVEVFDKEYVLAGVLARTLGINPTNAAEKLMELGAPAVSGPRIDGTLVYLFRRVDITRIDLKRLKSLRGYKTNTGRKPKGHGEKSAKASDTITAVDAAAALGLRVEQVHTLTRKGILKRAEVLSRAVHVERKSLDSLLRKLHHTDLVSVEKAAKIIGQSQSAFERLWIKRKIIRVRDLGFWRLIRTRDVEYLKSQLEGRVIASEAGRIIGMHRSYLPDLERSGKVKSIKLGKERPIRLYERADLEKIAKRGSLTQGGR